MDDLDKFDELLTAYKEQHPTAEDPQGLESFLGWREVMDILKNADGREIIFADSGRDIDRQKWRYSAKK